MRFDTPSGSPGRRLFDWRDQALVSLLFVASRELLLAAGLTMNFELRWMFLSDPVDLRERLAETLLYFHAYPPGMNLLTGLLLKVAGSQARSLAEALFIGCGLIQVNALLYLLRALRLPRPPAIAVATAFSLTPAFLFFENLYLYEAPVAALVCLAAALFHAAVIRPSTARWLGFFAVCAAIGYLRSTFHLLWFGVMIALALWATRSGLRRRVLLAAVGPAALLLALYVKNFVLFGVFAAASSGASNIAHVTVRKLPPEVREAWIDEGKLSPFASISVYSSGEAYLPYFGSSKSDRWPQLDALDRPSVGAPNFNHWFFLEVGKRRSADARYYLSQRPGDYARTVLASLGQLFEPSTIWHPADRASNSPHHAHRRLLGRYESIYNRIVHGFPAAPWGLYLFLPVGLVWALLHSRNATRDREGDGNGFARGALLLLAVTQIGFVVALSSVATIGESSRYRYQIESLIWITSAAALLSLVSRLRQARRRTPLAPTTTPAGQP